MEYRRFGNTIVARIDRGEEVLEQVAAIAQAEQIKLASVQALGAVGEFTVGVFHTAEKQYHANSFAGDFEIVSLTGTINTMEMVLVTSDYWNAVHGAEKGEVMQDTEGVEVIEKLGRNIAWMLKVIDKAGIEPPETGHRTMTNFIR